MLVKLMRKIYKNQKGITGLETAIILIAFVVVAAVFAYTVLSAGLFSSSKSSEAVYSGLEEAQSTLELKGSVSSVGVSMLSNAEVDWTDGAEGTSALDAADYVEGAGSVEITPTADAGILAYRDVTTNPYSWDMSGCKNVSFWMKSGADVSGTIGNGTVRLRLSENDDGSSPVAETLNIPQANFTGHWQFVTIALSGTTTNYDAVKSLAIVSSADSTSAVTINIDCITTDGFQDLDQQPNSYANQVKFIVSNVLQGNGMDFTATTDTYDGTDGSGDGDLTDEGTDQVHNVIITYSDKFQHTQNLAWTKTAVGQDNGNDILDPNEQFLVTVDLSFINNSTATTTEKIEGDSVFSIEVKPPVGAVMVFERTMPSIVHSVDILR